MKNYFRRALAKLLIFSLSIGALTACKSAPEDEVASLDDYYEEEIQQDSSKEEPDVEKPDDKEEEEQEKPSAPEPEKEEPEEKPSKEEPDEPEKEQPEENNPEENKPEEKDPQQDDVENEKEPEEETAPEKPEFSMDKALKVVTFNIKNAMGGKSIDQIAKMLKDLDADLIGLQEVYCNSPNASGGNQVQTIAEKAGYPYYYFTPCIEIGDNHTKYTGTVNAAGQAIISKHPILTCEVIWPSKQAEFGLRNFARHEIDVNGKIVAFYNCHLDFDIGRYQYEEVQDRYMSKDQYAICVGDFNETMDEMFLQFDYENFHSLAFGDEMENPYVNKNGKQPIDHIVVSKKTISWYDEEVQNGYYVVPHNGASDHNLIYGYFNLLD